MRCFVEISSSTMLYIPSFIKIVLGIHRLMERSHRHTDSMAISLADFVLIKRRRVETHGG
jgi:hypothetical protein